MTNEMTRTAKGEILLRRLREYDSQKLKAHLVFTRAEVADTEGHSAELVIDENFKPFGEFLRLTVTLGSTSLTDSFYLKSVKLYASGEIVSGDGEVINLPEVLYATIEDSEHLPYFLPKDYKWELKIFLLVPIILGD